MPIPRPHSGEGQDEFISRCVSQISGEYEQEQAVAICFDAFRNKNIYEHEEKPEDNPIGYYDEEDILKLLLHVLMMMSERR